LLRKIGRDEKALEVAMMKIDVPSPKKVMFTVDLRLISLRFSGYLSSRRTTPHHRLSANAAYPPLNVDWWIVDNRKCH